jgi:hypothetical protein
MPEFSGTKSRKAGMKQKGLLGTVFFKLARVLNSVLKFRLQVFVLRAQCFTRSVIVEYSIKINDFSISSLPFGKYFYTNN